MEVRTEAGLGPGAVREPIEREDRGGAPAAGTEESPDLDRRHRFGARAAEIAAMTMQGMAAAVRASRRAIPFKAVGSELDRRNKIQILPAPQPPTVPASTDSTPRPKAKP